MLIINYNKALRPFNGLQAGMFINKVLREDYEISSLLNNKIFPSLAVPETSFPFLAYNRNSMQVEYCKDGVYEEIVYMDLIICDDDFASCLDLATKIRNYLEYKAFPEYGVSLIELTGAQESADEMNAYTQILNIKITFN